ncbi:MAG: flagellar basal body protein [Pseudomonadota bacterium]
MDLNTTSLLSSLTDRMRHLAARTNVLAENIANADTPGFRARDVAPPSFDKMARREAMRVSDPRHVTKAASSQSNGPRIVDAPDPDASLNGNRVSVETQMMKLSSTRMDYQLASTVYRKGLAMIRLAARGDR